MTAITVAGLSKQFTFPVRNQKKGWLGNLLRPDIRRVDAVKDVSFAVSEGERLAFIGPNGAGKSTTIKMMTGILFPSAGEIKVLGFDPVKQRKELAYHIGTVFGQRSQLFPNLPLTDSLEFHGVMYDLSREQIKRRTADLVDLFHLEAFIDQPVRKLSLGQRMRAEIAASLVHRPKIIFLDEPTVGLDVVAKKALRELLLTVNKEEKTTVFLTSHDVGDIESLCDRTIVINHGTLVKDLPTQELAKSFISEKYIDLVARESFTRFPALPAGVTYKEKHRDTLVVSVDLATISVQEALQQLLGIFDVEDMDVYNADLETVIRHIYEGA